MTVILNVSTAALREMKRVFFMPSAFLIWYDWYFLYVAGCSHSLLL